MANLGLSPFISEMIIISLKESNGYNNLSLKKRINLFSTEVIAMQSFMVDQLWITALQNNKVKNIVCQQNESLLLENLSKNTIKQFHIKNQEYLTVLYVIN